MAAHRMLLLDFPAQNRRFQRNFRHRPLPLEEFSEIKLQKKYRFNSEGIHFICDLVRDDLMRDTDRNHSLNVETQVLVALKFFASGSFLDDVGDIFGIDKGTVSRIIHTVAASLVEQKDRFIRWPDAGERRHIRQTFMEKYRFPNVIGCVDGTHIKIQVPYPPREVAEAMAHPMLYEAAFFCRKHFYSINVQGICNHEGE
ncbi:putative nuclease HARBI1 [Lineus longissimus]|uniref:putative nuclease HARBI1 n=1 Tax=Lineus longissimus TaxID=88925 RepID=UPI00315C8109